MRALTLKEKLHFVLRGRQMAKEFYRDQLRSKDELKEIQNHRFLKVFRHACETVPFYRNKYQNSGVLVDKITSIDDIKELPVVEKTELIAGYPHDVLSSKYQDLKQLFLLVTGGTTGETIKIQHSMESIYASLVSYHRAYSTMMGENYRPKDVSAYVYTSDYPFKSIFGAYRQNFIWTLDSIEVIQEKLLKVRPHLLTAYPSVLERITKEISPQKRREIGSRLKVISVNSEMSSQSQRDDWESQWGVPVLDEFCSEEISTVMFHQCRHKNYHIQQDLCVLESVDDAGVPLEPGSEGNLVATSLWNYAMPLIRYNQGDRVVMADSQSSCSCGLCFPLLKSFQGRMNDAFTLPSGKILNSGYLLDVGYSALTKYSDAIKYWSLVQEKVDRVYLDCELEPGTSSEVITNIEREISKLFYGEAKAQVRVVDSPPRSKKGKRKQIVSNVPMQ